MFNSQLNVIAIDTDALIRVHRNGVDGFSVEIPGLLMDRPSFPRCLELPYHVWTVDLSATVLRESHGEILGLSGGCFRSSHRNFASRLRVLLVICRVALSYSNTLPLMSLPLCHIFDGLFVEQQIFSLIWGNPSFIQQHKTTFKNEYTEEKPFTTDAQMEKMPRHLSTDANRCRARNSLQLETTALQQMSSFHLNAPFIFVTKVNYVICM